MKHSFIKICNFLKFLIRWFKFNGDPKVTDEIKNQRILICKDCDTLKTGKIFKLLECDIEKGGCGCFLAEKTKFVFEQCPKEKW